MSSKDECKILVKKHFSEGKLILAICDSDLAGKRFESEDFQLDLSSDFYKGEAMPEEMIGSLLTKAYAINAAGKKSIDVLIKDGFVEKKNILFVEKIPFAQTVSLK